MKLIPVIVLSWLVCAPASALLKPENVKVADSKKTQAYVKDGLFTGGDRAIDDVTVSEIRRAANPAYERLVIDLEGTYNGEPAAVKRAPYYQVAVNPDEKRLVVTLWGSPKLGFDPRKVLGAFKRSPVVAGIELLPKLEDKMWTFTVNLKSGRPVEVFELTDPARIIVDIKTK